VLEQKGYVAHDKEPSGRAHVYRAIVPEQRARRSHLRDLVDRLFAGRPEELINGLLETETLSPDDLKALRQRIDQKLGRDKTGKGDR
jgi:predicted transcriptional regulator